jgi:hypothetical protein
VILDGSPYHRHTKAGPAAAHAFVGKKRLEDMVEVSILYFIDIFGKRLSAGTTPNQKQKLPV